MLTTLLHDLRHGARLLIKSPGFTTVAVAALAIGIGANTAIFSVVNTLLIQRLPYASPDRLVVVWEHNLPRDRRNNVVSPGNYLHWREMNTVFAEMSAVSMTFRAAYTGDGEPEEVPQQIVNAFALTRLMTKLLFNVTPADPVTFAAVAALLGGVAALASYLPGRRATRVDPVVALRAE